MTVGEGRQRGGRGERNEGWMGGGGGGGGGGGVARSPGCVRPPFHPTPSPFKNLLPVEMMTAMMRP